jgi:NTP pyrophosphatase (non-canonical NTP hydrolase)
MKDLVLKIESWAVKRNLHLADPSKQTLKLGEEFGELCQGLAKGKPEQVKDSIGDMFVVLTILSMQLGLTLNDCAEFAYDQIKDRKGKTINGVYVKETDLNLYPQGLVMQLKEKDKVINNYKQTLKFYANAENHEEELINESRYDADGICLSYDEYAPPVIFYDKGEKARLALEIQNDN